MWINRTNIENNSALKVASKEPQKQSYKSF